MSNLTPEERAALERLRAIADERPKNVVYGPLSVYEDVEDAMKRDQRVCAAALLRLVPADDDSELPVTEEWLRAVGFTIGWHGALNCFQEGSQIEYQQYVWRLNSMVYPRSKWQTRGDVRRLCAALGIPLQEAS